jgi:outer membrane receptor protein involved in Fe transport
LLVEELSFHVNAGTVHYTGGLYYQHLTRKDGTAYSLAQNFGFLGFLGAPAGSWVVSQSNAYYQRDLKSKALYSQADIDLSNELTLTLGARYTWDSGDFKDTQHANVGLPDPTGNFFAGFCSPGAISTFAGGFDAGSCTAFNNHKWSAPSFNLALTDKFNDKSMAYFKVAGGYQAGGFNNQIREEVFQTFNPEKTVEFEVGLKSDWELFGRPIRTNIDGFYGNSQNKQEVENGSYSDRTQWIAVFNAGSLTYYGSDLEMEYVLTDRIKLNTSWTHVESSYDSFNFPGIGLFNDPVTNLPTYAVPPRDLAGSQPAQVPKETVTASINVSWPLPSALGNVSSVLTFYHRSKVNFADVANLGTFTPDSNTGDAFNTSNFTTDWKGIFGTKLDVGLWVKNLFDKDYPIYKSPQAGLGYATTTFGDPRTYGMHVRYSF